MDLCWDLKFILDFPLHKNDRETLSNKIYDLNVGETYKVFGYEFKLLTKSTPQPKYPNLENHIFSENDNRKNKI